MSLVRALWAALLGCALAGASAERYGDYAASMPLYSLEDGARDVAPPAEDYLERSPDAPLPYDYKYEERVRGRLHLKVKLPINIIKLFISLSPRHYFIKINPQNHS